MILSDGSQGEIEKGERELWGWSAVDRISRDVMRDSVRGACFGVVLSPTGSFNGFYSLNAASDNRNAKSVGLRLWKVCIVRVNLFELSLFRSF